MDRKLNNNQSTLLNKIVKTNQSVFLNEILEFILGNGLGAVTKKDIELYIVYLLKQYANKNSIKISNHEWSNLLKVPERRIKTLLLESGLRFSNDDDKERDELWFEFYDLIREGYVELNDKGDKITITVENPLLIRFIESRLKKLNLQTSDYSFNPELVKFSFAALEGLVKESVSDLQIDERSLIVKDKIKKIKWKKIGAKTAKVLFGIINKQLGDTVAESLDYPFKDES